MKITHNKVGQNLNLVDGSKSEKTDKSNGAKEAKASSGSSLFAPQSNEATKVDLSPRAMEAKKIKEIAMSAPDVDEAKVEKFRKMIDEGTYKVDAKSIADKMVDEELQIL